MFVDDRNTKIAELGRQTTNNPKPLQNMIQIDRTNVGITQSITNQS